MLSFNAAFSQIQHLFLHKKINYVKLRLAGMKPAFRNVKRYTACLYTKEDSFMLLCKSINAVSRIIAFDNRIF